LVTEALERLDVLHPARQQLILPADLINGRLQPDAVAKGFKV